MTWTDPLATPTWQLLENRMRGVNAYRRPAMFLETLAGLMGEERWTRVLRVYHERWRYRHPRPVDFLATLKELAAGTRLPFGIRIAHLLARIFRRRRRTGRNSGYATETARNRDSRPRNANSPG